MTKSQIYLLLAIKTASTLQKDSIQISFKKTIIPLLITLYRQGLIQNFIKLGTNIVNNQKIFLIYLRYFFNKPVFKNLKFFSKPSSCLYFNFLDICLLQDKKHIVFLSTPKGILTNLECKVKKTGGLVLFRC